MIAASAPMNTTTAASAVSEPTSAHCPSRSGMTRSASEAPRSAKRGIAARPISITTAVVVSGMKVMIAKERFSVAPRFAA